MNLFDDARFNDSRSLFEDDLEETLYEDDLFERDEDIYEDDEDEINLSGLFEDNEDDEWERYEMEKRREEEERLEEENRMYDIIAEEEYRYYEYND